MALLNSCDIKKRLDIIRYNIDEAADKAGRNPKEISLMAVTKTVEPKLINIVCEYNVDLLGENRVQEFLDKKDDYIYKKNKIHFIGHLQTNKVKYIIDKISVIESVSSLKLAKEINQRAAEKNIVMDILLEVNISEELSKSGFLKDNLIETLNVLSEFGNIKTKGLMCIPARENSEYFFEQINQLFLNIKQMNIENADMKYLSMGMSADYQQAVLHNSNIIRLGSAIFGERNIGG